MFKFCFNSNCFLLPMSIYIYLKFYVLHYFYLFLIYFHNFLRFNSICFRIMFAYANL